MKTQTIHPKVLAACQYIDSCTDYLPSLGEIAERVAASPTHLQKTFKQTLGISPREYADSLRRKRLKNALANGDDILDALYNAGYGSTSRLYEKTNQHMGMTPKEYQRKGEGKSIYYAIVKCPLGYLLLAATDKGLCSIRISDKKAPLKSLLAQEFAKATLVQGEDHLQEWIQLLVNYLSGHIPWPKLPFDVKATAFQHKVWSYLQTIPSGKTQYYSDVAEAIGMPKAARAVARACASNPLALIVPCHRVLPKSGGIGGYRWGVKRKEQLLALEQKN